MAASLTDILTTQKNGVVAINQLSSIVFGVYNNMPTVQLAQAALGVTVATLYTAASGVKSHVNSINVCNTTAASISVYIFLVPLNGTAGTANALFYAVPVPANTTVLWESTQIIVPGGTLRGYASATGVTVTISGGDAG